MRFLALLFFPVLACAEGFSLSASNGVEWRANEKMYIATGNAVATSGENQVRADVLRGFYQQNGTKTDITRVEAIGNVRLTAPGGVGSGARAVYNLMDKTFTLTGNPKLSAKNYTLTAANSIVYSMASGQATATGGVRVWDGKSTLSANSATAYFTKKPDGGIELARVAANGNVKIISQNNSITGGAGEYNAANQTAALKQGVRLNNGKNTAAGQSITTNLTTGVSTLKASEGGRVSGTLYVEKGVPLKK